MKKEVLIRALSLEDAYKKASEQVGPEFDVLEIKKVPSRFAYDGSSAIEMRVSPVFTDKFNADNSWELIVSELRALGFRENLIVKLLRGIRSSGKHLKFDPISLVVERLGHYCQNTGERKGALSALIADQHPAGYHGISAYIFSEYANGDLSGEKIVLTNSKKKLLRILGPEFMSILKLQIHEVMAPQDWIDVSPRFGEQKNVCGVFFKSSQLSQTLSVPEPLGKVNLSRLVYFYDSISEEERGALRHLNASLFVCADQASTFGARLRLALDSEVPVSFVLIGRDYLNGLCRISDVMEDLEIELKKGVQDRLRRAG